MRQSTLPPEMLPKATGPAEVVVCCNPTQCTEQEQKASCPFCLRAAGDAEEAIAQIGQPN